jgi:hypothetical protein
MNLFSLLSLEQRKNQTLHSKTFNSLRKLKYQNHEKGKKVKCQRRANAMNNNHGKVYHKKQKSQINSHN